MGQDNGSSELSSPLRICIVSGADQIRSRSYINHAIYARLHGMDFRLECGVGENISNKFFYKTSIISRVLPLYDWIVWMDDDTYFTDFTRDNLRRFIEEAERDEKFLVVAEGPLEPNGFWSYVNTGVMCIKNSQEARDLFGKMSEEVLQEVADWWDPKKHGTFTNSDQDITIWWLLTSAVEDRVSIVDHRELNSRGHYYTSSLEDAFVMHFCGYPDKEIGAIDFGRRFGLGQELVPENLLDKYSVRTRDPMSRPEQYVRRQAWHLRGRLKPYLKPIRDWYRERDSRKS